jgi:predicted nucleotidyltransferase
VDLDQGRGLLDLGGLLCDLHELLGVEVDVVESRSVHPYIRDRVLAEAVSL